MQIILLVKIILNKSPDEWAATKQACRDELVVYLLFFLQQYSAGSKSASLEHYFLFYVFFFFLRFSVFPRLRIRRETAMCC